MDVLKRRIIFVFFFFCFLFFVIWVKAFKLQVIDRKVLLARSANQIFREVRNYPGRGNIYDREGHPLALNIQTYSIFTIPQKNAFEQSYKTLAQIIPQISYKSIKESIHKRDRYTWLARKIPLTTEQVQKIKKLKGIYIDSVPKRMYPNQELASQIIGFVGIDNVGLSGVEYQFDEQLRGRPQIIKYVQDARGRPIKFVSQKLGVVAQDLQLSISKELQAQAEAALKEAIIQNKAISGGIGVMDINTGEILAMANYPTFNPNSLKQSRLKDRKLPFISDPLEPGSLFKIFTVASALENKIAGPDTNYYCNLGKIVVDGHEINEADKDKNYEWLSVRDIVKYSSNVGTVKLAFDLTFPKLYRTLKKFGIGEKTGIELPAESRGIFRENKGVTPLELSNISFGQGVATTGIQILAAYSAIANGGYKVYPTILKRNKRPVERARILSSKISHQLLQMLEGAVEKGTGHNAKIKYFKIAGKTSTAQRPGREGGYDGYIAGFVGFPLGIKNSFVIYVYIDGPQREYYGNRVAAPVFKRVTQHMLYKRDNFNPLAINDQTEEEEESRPKRELLLASRVKLEGDVPNFKGLDKRSSNLLASKWSIDINHIGAGVVYKQHPLPYQKADKGEVVMLYYRPPRNE